MQVLSPYLKPSKLIPVAELEVKTIGSNDTLLLSHSKGTIQMLGEDAQQVMVEVSYV